MSKIKIAIDAGHGSDTAGKRTCKLTKNIGQFKKGTQIHEHWINAYICVRLAKALKKLGYDVYKSAWDDDIVTDDADIALGTRQANIKNANCTYSISVHQNASGDGVQWSSGNGVEVLIHADKSKVKDSKKMAEYVLVQLIEGTKQTNRGVKTQELAMCNCLAMGTKASILVECAFMTNQKETESMLANVDNWDESAEEIAKGIHNYINVV